MQGFDLQALFHINGIGSASGLIYNNNTLFIISDTSTYLYEYLLNESKLNRISLFEDSQENISKKDKSDFESITLKGNDIYIYGSGSTINRNHCLKYNLNTRITSIINLASKYEKLKKEAQISDEDLNIEGVFYSTNKWFYFQRGNGANAKNGVFISEKGKSKIVFLPIPLPKIQNIEATFTDAILLKEHIYFLAAAENTNSTYEDGEVFGSYIGCLSLSTFEIIFIKQISDKIKFEGLTVYKESEKEIELFLCEDNDTEVLETVIYKLNLKF